MKRTIFIIAAAITALAILAVGCGDSSVNSGGESKYLNMFLDVFSKNPGQNNDTGGTSATNATYTLTVNVSPAEGGIVSRNINQSSYNAGTSITLTATPEAGYMFGNWSGALSATNAQITIVMDSDKTLTAGFRKEGVDLPAFDVYFNANGATNGSAPPTENTTSGNSITLPGQASMENPGYSFAGWSENTNGTGIRYNANSSYTVTHGTTLYAKWIPIYTVTYDGNGATRGDAPPAVTVDSGTTITLPLRVYLIKEAVSPMTAIEYVFDGWSTTNSNTGDNYAAGAKYTVTNNVTLYAKWIPKNASMASYSFNGNGNTRGEISTVAIMYRAGTVITLPDNLSLEKDGYYFDGWCEDDPSCRGTVYPAGTSYTLYGITIFYAKWVALPNYRVTFNGNGTTGGSPPASVETYSGNTITLPEQGTMVKTGYRFDGWNTNSAGTGTNYGAGASYTVSGNVTLYAKWTASNLAVPNAPGTPNVLATSSSSITVSWAVVSEATGYYVYRSTSANGSYSVVIATGSTTYTDNNLSSGTTYYYKISAYNSNGESQQSSYSYAPPYVAVPGVPTNVTASAASSSSIVISWSAVSGVTGYRVYRSTSANGSYSSVVATASTSYTDINLSPCTTYYYKVSAYNNGGESSQSSYDYATTNVAVPGVPTNVSATATSSSSITISWPTVTGATVYNLYRSTTASGAYSLVTSTTSTSYTDNNLLPGTTYCYRVTSNNCSGQSSQSSYVCATTDLAAPGTPNVQATSPSSITISWPAVSGATGYRVYRSTSAGGSYTLVGTTASTSYTDNYVSSGTTYYYKISAYNSSGESQLSSYVYATPPYAPPGVPTNVTATAISSSSITVSWSAVSGATEYRVYRSTSASGSYTYIGYTTTSTSYTNTGLSSGTTYYYKVSAYNSGGGESSQSSYSYATTGDVNNIEMVYVTGGTFTMGCTSEQGNDCYGDESPTHSVTLSGYYIGKYEVTQGLWKAVMGSLPEWYSSYSSYGVGDNHPVYFVSWNDIVNDFLPELNRKTGKSYRLPTEAEWEYAARGRSNSNGYMYSGSNTIGNVAWYWDNSDRKTHPVGGRANGLGIYDMSGNVWEWVNDRYGDYSSSAQTNPTGPTIGSDRVGRGGSWRSDARNCRVSNRDYFDPDYRDNIIGFRLAVSP